jgi:pimeloyl-ACP methyl ester carboxylesterase
MRVLGRLVAAGLAVAALLAAPAQARIGVVLLHGNLSSPLQFYDMLTVFEDARIGVQIPEMCWSGRRSYDRPVINCMRDVDLAIDRLKAGGHDQIVVAGHSMGGINALLYAAHHTGLAGIVVFAPGERTARPDSDPAVVIARDIVARGGGGARTQLPLDGRRTLLTVPRAWLSFFGPDSPLDDSQLLPKLTAPLLWVAGTEDRGQDNAAERFALAPSLPMNRLLLVKADHFRTPEVALPIAISWLNELQAWLDNRRDVK